MRAQRIVNRSIVAGLSVSLLLTLGCASIVGGVHQSVSIETRSAGGQVVEGATCKLENEKGTWYLTTPGQLTVHRASGDLHISCTKGGQPFGSTVAMSSVRGWMYGNLLAGGLIGFGVDMGTGGGFEYKDRVTVTSRFATRPSSDAGTPAFPSAATASTPSTMDDARELPSVRRNVASGVSVTIAAHADWDSLCHTEGPTPKVTMLTSTQHGTLEIKEGNFPAPDDHANSPCAGGYIYGTRIVYRSNPTFHGHDQLRYEVDTENGHFTRDVDIAVK